MQTLQPSYGEHLNLKCPPSASDKSFALAMKVNATLMSESSPQRMQNTIRVEVASHWLGIINPVFFEGYMFHQLIEALCFEAMKTVHLNSKPFKS